MLFLDYYSFRMLWQTTGCGLLSWGSFIILSSKADISLVAIGKVYSLYFFIFLQLRTSEVVLITQQSTLRYQQLLNVSFNRSSFNVYTLLLRTLLWRTLLWYVRGVFWTLLSKHVGHHMNFDFFFFNLYPLHWVQLLFRKQLSLQLLNTGCTERRFWAPPALADDSSEATLHDHI